MSQPLTGQVDRLIESKRFSISHIGRQLLFTLANRIPPGRNEWRTTWRRLASSMDVNEIWLRKTAYELQKEGMIELSQLENGLSIRLLFVAHGCAENAQGGCAENAQGAVRKTHSLDRGINMRGARPEKRPSSQSSTKGKGGIKDVTAAQDVPPPSPSVKSAKTGALASPYAQNGRPLSPSERISLEREVQRLDREITRLRNRDRSDDEQQRLQQFEARVDRNLEQLGQLPVYRKGNAARSRKGDPMSVGEMAQVDPKVKQLLDATLKDMREAVRQRGRA